METKINIAAILKDKPQGTKLYDWLHNIDVEFDTISTTDMETVVWCTNETNNNTTCHRGYSEFGTERGYPDGLQILFPSKEMRDWTKFSWKKGDVLVSNDGKKRVIFVKFQDNRYMRFFGKFFSHRKEDGDIDYKSNLDAPVNDYTFENMDAAQTYIKAVEERCGGKLNLETLKIEKKTKFEDGDIAFADYGNRQYVFIVSGETGLSEGYNSSIYLDLSSPTSSMAFRTSFFKKDLCELRLATEEEKKQLFSALKKKGKVWNSEHKMIVDLKPKCEFKPFDKVLVRDFSRDKWSISFFSFKKEDCYVCINHCSWNQCIPYIGNESLLGTTKDVEG